MPSDGTNTYGWNAEGRMNSAVVGSTSIAYTFNALGERVEAQVGANYHEYVYDPAGVEVGRNDRGTSFNWEYLFIGERRFGKYQDNVTYFSHPDMLHTMGTVTDQTGATIQDVTYYPWGSQWNLVGTAKDQRFAAMHQRDEMTDLDPTHFRMFSSSLSRWMSPDPAKGCGANPQNHNRYAYVANGPTDKIDPRGDQFYYPACSDPLYAESHAECPNYVPPWVQTSPLAYVLVGAAAMASRETAAHGGGGQNYQPLVTCKDCIRTTETPTKTDKGGTCNYHCDFCSDGAPRDVDFFFPEEFKNKPGCKEESGRCPYSINIGCINIRKTSVCGVDRCVQNEPM